MHKSFFPLFFLSLAGVISTALFGHNNWMWAGLCAGLAPIVLYHIILFSKSNLSSTEVDSIYYFGFLVTVVTLVVTALSIGLEQGRLDINSVLVKFALGLIATGYALFARLHLLTKLSSQAEVDVVQATENLAKSVENVALKFDQAGHHVTAFIEQTEKRMLDASNHYASRLNEAALAFNKTLADTATASLANSYLTIDTAARQFSYAITAIMKEVTRIQSEAESINFANAAQRLESFSASMESSIASMTTLVTSASETSAAAIEGLGDITKKSLQTSDAFTAHLEPLGKLDTLLSTLKRTTTALEEIADEAAHTSDSIAALGLKFTQSEQTVSQNIIEPLSANSLSEAIRRLVAELTQASKQAASLSQLMAEQQVTLKNANGLQPTQIASDHSDTLAEQQTTN